MKSSYYTIMAGLFPSSSLESRSNDTCHRQNQKLSRSDLTRVSGDTERSHFLFVVSGQHRETPKHRMWFENLNEIGTSTSIKSVRAGNQKYHQVAIQGQ
jgi:hypothetical protein